MHMSGPPRLALVPQNTSLPSDATDGSMILEAGVDLRSGRLPLAATERHVVLQAEGLDCCLFSFAYLAQCV